MTDKTSDFIGSDDAVRKHYQASLAAEDLLARIKARIVALGVGPEAEREIAQLDHFHMRGSRATAELAQLAGIVPGIKILDAGSGLGGPSRYLATQHGCSVVGVDLSPAFVELAAMLAQRVETEDRLSYEVGNIAKLRFAEESFDLVWCEHVMMNLPDRASTYRNFYRILRPEGRFAFYEPIAIEGAEPPHYPTPWAETPSDSHLLTRVEIETALTAAGFIATVWKDASHDAVQAIANQAPPDPSALNLGLVMGSRFSAMAKNFARNILEGRIGLAMGLAIKQG